VIFGFQVKPNLFGQSRHLFIDDQPPKNKQSRTAAVVWFKTHGNRYTNTKPDVTFKSVSSRNNNVLDSKGLPSAEQLHCMYNKLEENVSIQ